MLTPKRFHLDWKKFWRRRFWNLMLRNLGYHMIIDSDFHFLQQCNLRDCFVLNGTWCNGRIEFTNARVEMTAFYMIGLCQHLQSFAMRWSSLSNFFFSGGLCNDVHKIHLCCGIFWFCSYAPIIMVVSFLILLKQTPDIKVVRSLPFAELKKFVYGIPWSVYESTSYFLQVLPR